MEVHIGDKEMEMALLNGLPDHCDATISALDTLGNNDTHLILEFVKIRCAKGEPRQSKRQKDFVSKYESAALLTKRPSNQGT